MADKKFSLKVQCRHFLNSAPMEIVSEFSRVVDTFEYHKGNDIDVFKVYELLQCPACFEISLQAYQWCDAYMETPDDTTIEILYPSKEVNDIPLCLPNNINIALTVAHKVKSIYANAFGVLMRRVLKIVCIDRKASGKNLADQLQDLAEKNEIPEKLVMVAKNLKNLGNIGAHHSLGNLTRDEILILNALSNAILEFVYTAPYLANQAEECLNKLKAKSESKKVS